MIEYSAGGVRWFLPGLAVGLGLGVAGLRATAESGGPAVAGVSGQLPLMFEPCPGPKSGVAFRSRTPGMAVWMTAEEARLALRPAAVAGSERGSSVVRSGAGQKGATAEVRLRWLGANPEAAARPERELSTRVHHFLGNDSGGWRQGVKTYGAVRYVDVYPGIDVVFYGNGRQLEYDWVVHPEADVSQVRFAVEGAEEVRLSPEGDLVLCLPGGEVRQRRPVVYQDTECGRVAVSGRYVAELGVGEVWRFEIGAYDDRRPLVIDPVVLCATYLGGSLFDACRRVAVDAEGNVLVAGETLSADFPVRDALWPYNRGGAEQALENPFGNEAFVAKLDRSGTNLVYATYLGGTQIDAALALAVDAGGGVWVAGLTQSPDFPVTTNAWSRTIGGVPDRYGFYSLDGFITHLSADGSSLLYSTYLGGSLEDEVIDMTLGGDGSVYVAGATISTDFPLTGTNSVVGGARDVFVARWTGTDTELVSSVRFGAWADDLPLAVEVDGAGGVWICGYTGSVGLPVTNAYQPIFGGGVTDGFVARLGPEGVWDPVTYLGGDAADWAHVLAFGSTGSVIVAGSTYSGTFAMGQPIGIPAPYVAADVFVIQLKPEYTNAAYCTRVGGLFEDVPWAIHVGGDNQVTVAGTTASYDFPVLRPLQSTLAGATDGFLLRLGGGGTNLVFSTYLGGNRDDEIFGMAPATNDTWWLVGQTASANLLDQWGLDGWQRTNVIVGADGLVMRVFAGESALSIEAGMPGVVQVSWPRGLEGFQLQSAASMGMGAAWGPVVTPPAVVGDEFRVVLTNLSWEGYFRLERP